MGHTPAATDHRRRRSVAYPPSCSYLTPADLAAAACTHRAWREAAVGEEALWRGHCEREWALDGMQPAAAPDRAPLPSFHAAYGAWHAEFGRYGQLVTRARHAWRAIEQWTAQHCPAIRASLRCGACSACIWMASLQLATRHLWGVKPCLPRPLLQLTAGANALLSCARPQPRTPPPLDATAPCALPAAPAPASPSWRRPSSSWATRCRRRCVCCTACTMGRSWSSTGRQANRGSSRPLPSSFAPACLPWWRRVSCLPARWE
mgnify:CR=1 FL=1